MRILAPKTLLKHAKMCQIVQNERELIKNVPKCVDSQQYLNYIKIQKTCLNLQDPPKSEKCIKIRQTY